MCKECFSPHLSRFIPIMYSILYTGKAGKMDKSLAKGEREW